eukprot:jgi/Hompol1/2331/HPOL_002966-RA
MIVARSLEPAFALFTRQLAVHLIDTPLWLIVCLVGWLVACLISSTQLSYVDFKLQDDPAFGYQTLISQNPKYTEKLKFWSPEKTQVPPVIPFHLGSLGFLTVFNITDIHTVLDRVIGCAGDGVRVNMRMRLSCTVFRHVAAEPTSTGASSFQAASNAPSEPIQVQSTIAASSKNHAMVTERAFGNIHRDDSVSNRVRSPLSRPLAELLSPRETIGFSQSFNDTIDSLALPSVLSVGSPELVGFSSRLSAETSRLSELEISQIRDSTDARIDAKANNNRDRTSSIMDSRLNDAVAAETFQILNDLVVDRGPSAYMSQLELFVDDKHLTTVQADGLVISTPTGSTAYSLKIQVPIDSRNTAWASFDGRHRIELKQGDSIAVTMSRWPVPTVCMEDQSSDWFESLRRCLHWNERTRQRPLANVSADSDDAQRILERIKGLALDEIANELFHL